MSNCIEFRLCDEDRARLDKIIEGLSYHHNCKGCVETAVGMTKDLAEAAAAVQATQEAPKAEPKAEEHPADAVPPHGAPEPVAEPEKPKHTKADVLAIVQRLIKPGSNKREAAKDIVNDYAKKISDIPADKIDEAMERLTKLEQEG